MRGRALLSLSLPPNSHLLLRQARLDPLSASNVEEEAGFRQSYFEPIQEIASRMIQARARGIFHRKKAHARREEMYRSGDRMIRAKRRHSLHEGTTSRRV